MLSAFRGKGQISMEENLCVFFFFFLISHIVLRIILLSLIPSLWSRVGGLARSSGLIYGERAIPSLSVEGNTAPPFLSPCWNPALCDLGPFCVSVCLIATWAYALQFSMAPLILFSKSSQSSRTKWEGKQSFHMKRGQQNPGGASCWDSPFQLCDHTA